MRDAHMHDEPACGLLSKEDPKQVLYPAGKLAEFAGARIAQDLWSDAFDWSRIDPDRLARELDRLPPIEADLVELTMRGSTQSELAAVFGFSQANVSYRLKNALDTLRWRADQPEFEEDELRLDLTRFVSERWLEPLILFHRTENMSTVAHLLGKTKSAGRYAVIRGIELITGEPELARYADYFRKLLARIGHTPGAGMGAAVRLARLKAIA